MANNWKITETKTGRTIDTKDMFFVEVNNRYIVKVQANSHSNAEHKLLDMFGVQTANAYDMFEVQHGYMNGALCWCETISLDELENKSRQAKIDCEDMVSLAMEAENAFLKLWDSAKDCANTYGGIDSALMASAREAWEDACKDTAQKEHEMDTYAI